MTVVKVLCGGLLFGDAFHIIPFFNKIMHEHRPSKIIWIAGSFVRDVPEFLTHFYPLEVVIKDDISVPVDINARVQFQQRYQDEFNKIEADLAFDDLNITWERGFYYPKESLFLMNADKLEGEAEDSIVVHPYTRNTWKQVRAMTQVDWSQFNRTVYSVGMSNEFLVPNSIDLRGAAFFDVAKRIVNARISVCIHSAVACLAMYLRKPTIVCHPWALPPTFSDFSDRMYDLISPMPEDIVGAVTSKL